jgi:hypothetical protein
MLRELIKQAAWPRCFDNGAAHRLSRSSVASHQPVPANALKLRRLLRRTGMARSEFRWVEIERPQRHQSRRRHSKRMLPQEAAQHARDGRGDRQLPEAAGRFLQAASLSCIVCSSCFSSSVITLKRANWAGPKAVEIATSAASRPLAITMRPIRG